MAFSGRLPSKEELESVYSHYERPKSLPEITLVRYREILNKLSQLTPGRTLLDVGAGAGHFVEEAQRLGWNATGLDFDSGAVESAKARGVKLTQGELGADSYQEGQFDVITSIEVLEHLMEPGATVQRIAQLLKPGGIFFLTTPNFGSITRRLLGPSWRVLGYPDHVNHFEVSSMKKLLEEKFETLEVATTGVSPGEIWAHIFGDRSRLKSVARPSSLRKSEQELRNLIENNAGLRWAKKFLNIVLSVFRMGDTLKLTTRKRV